MKELESRLDNQEGGQMSFLEHLDELRKRIVRSAIIVVIAFIFCFFFSDEIFRFLSVPIVRALNEAEQSRAAKAGFSDVDIIPLSSLKTGDRAKYAFERTTMIGTVLVQSGATVNAVVANDANGKTILQTDEPLVTTTGLLPQGTRIPIDLTAAPRDAPIDARLIVQTSQEPFTLYVTVALYAAIAMSVPLLLLQVWGFISPALYAHEKSYVTPFILLSSTAFVGGAAFAYYILFPPAVGYLLGIGEDFQPLLRATDYFDLITLIMLAMGIIFQMPAVTYVLARIGIVTAGFLVRIWKIALFVILIVAAFVSPTGDIPNLMLFALPMIALYIISIAIAWVFGKKRLPEPTE